MRSLQALLTIVLAALSVAACSSGETEADRAARAGILLVGNGAEPKTIDPGVASGIPERDIINSLYEGLVVVDPADATKVLPGVAESWENEGTFRTWTFHLRRDAKWSNGDPVTAQDFVYSWRRALTPALGFELVEIMYVLAGAETFNKGTGGPDQVGVAAPDPHTLIVRLEHPTPTFPLMLTFFGFHPVHAATVEANGGLTNRRSPWTVPGKIVTNGPFALAKWETNHLLEVRKNPNYWDAANVGLNAVRFFPIENSGSEEMSFQDGRLHITSTVPTDKLPGYRDDPRYHNDPMVGLYFYNLNTLRKPFDDRRVRQALSLAIDRKLLVERVTQGGQTPAGGMIPIAFKGIEVIPAPRSDPAHARKLLAEAGYPGGKGFPPAEILMNTSDAHLKIAQAIQAMWKEALGIEITITNQEWKVYVDSLRAKNFDIARSGWIAPYMDPVAMLEGMSSGAPNNDSSYSNPQFDALLARSRRTGDLAERYRILEQADRLVARDMPVIPIYWYSNSYLMDPRVKGWLPQPRDDHPWKFVSLKSD